MFITAGGVPRHVTCGSGGEEQASSKRANTLSNKGLEDGAVYLVVGCC